MICQEYTRWAPSDLPLYMALWVFNWSYFSHGKDRGPPADRRPPLVRLAARKWEWAPSNIRRKRHAKRKKKTARTSKSTILGGRISLKFASKIVESSCLLLTPCLGSMLRLGHLLWNLLQTFTQKESGCGPVLKPTWDAPVDPASYRAQVSA